MALKTIAKHIVVSILGRQVRLLRKKHQITVVAVAGSVGKTSTKLAIAQLLGATLRVRYQAGNYNDIVSVPLIFFGQVMPPLTNPLAWFKVFRNNSKQIQQAYPYDVVVVELGTDGPGQLKKFQQYLRADIGVLTAIAPEHMEFFSNLDDVAREELFITHVAETVIYNDELCAQSYTQPIKRGLSYGLDMQADYQMRAINFQPQSAALELFANGELLFKLKYPAVSVVQLYSVVAAAAVAHQLAMPISDIQNNIAEIQPVPGRMNLLKGKKGSSIIDDTYNASPEAAKAALDALYAVAGNKKVALLGNMNELGKFSPEAHSELGSYCDPARLDLVVTLGEDANTYLADAAEKNGCKVIRATSPIEAASHIEPLLTSDTVVLAKGSQNGVFAEEAVKLLIADKADIEFLVRQSDVWLTKKRQQFKDMEG